MGILTSVQIDNIVDDAIAISNEIGTRSTRRDPENFRQVVALVANGYLQDANRNIAPLQAVPVLIATAGPATYTAAQILTGLVLRDPAGASRSDVTPTAALIVAAIPNAVIGSVFEFVLKNEADAAETITVTAGAGVTLAGTMTIAQNNQRRFRAQITAIGTPGVLLTSIGTSAN
ncbi:MAG: hypothetical protein ACRC78_02160 [Planktothrix sp.]